MAGKKSSSMAFGKGPGAGGSLGTGGGMRTPHTGRKNVFVPPGGFAGFAAQSPATQAVLRLAGIRAVRTSRGRKKKKRSAASGTTRKRTRRASTRKGRARLVKGSAAARAHMAKLRKMRRK
jgi:hypothetical protein